MPKERRFAQLKAYLGAGARFFLAGHTHRMAVRGWEELTVLNAETTSRNTDSRPFPSGYARNTPDTSMTLRERVLF